MNKVHKLACIDETVELGTNNVIGPFCYITGRTKIGNNNVFDSHCTIGGPAEIKGRDSEGGVIIGNGNHFGEHCNVHAAIEKLNDTTINDNCYIMCFVHVGHDSSIGYEGTCSSATIIGGHSVIHPYANIGLGAVIHQKRSVGAYAMVGMNSTVTKSIPPYVVAWGSPAKPYRINIVGLQRRNMDPQMIEAANLWLNKQQTGVEIRNELSHLIEEQVKFWQEQDELL